MGHHLTSCKSRPSREVSNQPLCLDFSVFNISIHAHTRLKVWLSIYNELKLCSFSCFCVHYAYWVSGKLLFRWFVHRFICHAVKVMEVIFAGALVTSSLWFFLFFNIRPLTYSLPVPAQPSSFEAEAELDTRIVLTWLWPVQDPITKYELQYWEAGSDNKVRIKIYACICQSFLISVGSLQIYECCRWWCRVSFLSFHSTGPVEGKLFLNHMALKFDHILKYERMYQ